MSADLGFALALADAADAAALPRFRAADLRIESKSDGTPVTDADRAIERLLRARIARERPGDAVLGEEEGASGEASGKHGRRWILDPIDATRNFARGIPVWATLIALERDGHVVCGVVSAPALGQRWWAALAEGAYANGARIHVSGIRSLAQAAISASRPLDGARLEPLVSHLRGFGDFWQHVLVAEGALDAAIDTHLARWDYAALEPILTEAGGTLGWLGERLVSSNALLDEQLEHVL